MAEHEAEEANGAREPKEQPQDDHAVSTEAEATENTAPPLPDEAPPLPDEAPPLPDEQAPPLPDEAVPQSNELDDGWVPTFDPTAQTWFFFNRFTGITQWENPRIPDATTSSHNGLISSIVPSTVPSSAGPPGSELSPLRRPVAGGYNPAIHGDYDPNADYALEAQSDDEQPSAPPPDPNAIYATVGSFNRFTGKWQAGDKGPELHNDENKSKRQMNAFFDVDAAANSHDGRSLKAERQQKKLSKQEVKAFKEKRRAKKEEKRRAWLMD